MENATKRRILFLEGQSCCVSKATLWEIIGVENITLPEAICLVSFVVVPMIYVGLVNPAQLGFAFITFASPAYIIAVLVSARRENQYNAP